MSSKSANKPSGGQSVVIEIGNDWLKMMQADSARGSLAVSKLYLEKFQSAGAELSQSISGAIKKLKFSKRPVIAYLPRQLVTIRMLELPSVDPAEIADMVDLQVGKQTPYSKDEIVSDYKILGSDREGYCRIMLVIVQRGVLRQRFSILEDAGVEVQKMSVSSEGLLNWCRMGLGGTDKATAVLDVDSFYTDFAVISKGSLVFTRSILVGANQLTEDYEVWKEKLAREVKQSLEMCASEAHGKIPAKLVVSGAGARMPDLSVYLGGQLNLPSEVRDSLKNVTKMPSEPSLDDEEYRAVSLTSMIGAALAPESLEFNLVPDSVMLRKGLEQKARILTVFGVLVMTLLVSASLYGTMSLYFKRDTLNRLQKELKESEPAVRNINRMLEIVRINRERRDTKFTMVNILSEIHKLVPQGVTLNLIGIDLDKETGSVTVNGEGPSMEEVQTFVSALERSVLLKDVKDTTKKGEGAEFKFQIECSLEK